MDVPFTSSDVCLGERRNVRYIEKDPESKGFGSSSCFDSWKTLSHILSRPTPSLSSLLGWGWEDHPCLRDIALDSYQAKKRLGNKAHLLYTSAIRASRMISSQADERHHHESEKLEDLRTTPSQSPWYYTSHIPSHTPRCHAGEEKVVSKMALSLTKH